jgi:anti-sigma regulatory factor (Ser/Thr protein kinase)
MSAAPENLDLDLPATLDGLQAGLAAIEQHCIESGLPAATLARTLTVFEEIFTNTMKYGYRGQEGRRIRAMLTGADPLRLTVEDSAPPFDPTAWDPSADLAGDVSTRPVGRLGIAIVMGLARNARWQPLAPGNRLTLEFTAAAPG